MNRSLGSKWGPPDGVRRVSPLPQPRSFPRWSKTKDDRLGSFSDLACDLGVAVDRRFDLVLAFREARVAVVGPMRCTLAARIAGPIGPAVFFLP